MPTGRRPHMALLRPCRQVAICLLGRLSLTYSAQDPTAEKRTDNADPGRNRGSIRVSLPAADTLSGHKIAAGIDCCPGHNRLRGIELMPQKTNYAADAGRIAELQRDIRSGALSASALVERCGPEPRRMSGGRSTPYSIGTAFGARSWTQRSVRTKLTGRYCQS